MHTIDIIKAFVNGCIIGGLSILLLVGLCFAPAWMFIIPVFVTISVIILMVGIALAAKAIQ